MQDEGIKNEKEGGEDSNLMINFVPKQISQAILQILIENIIYQFNYEIIQSNENSNEQEEE